MMERLQRHRLFYQEYFTQVVRRQQLAHAYLFTGNDEVGKERLATYIVQLLAHSGKSETDWPNSPLYERINHNQYADLLYLEPEGRQIKVDQIRLLKEWLATTPVEKDFKLAVIRQADTMNLAASNALLRLLEEPGENIYLFLLSPDADKLLPTIQSRVQEIYLAAPDQEAAKVTLLADIDNRDHAALMALFSLEMLTRLKENYQVDSFEAWLGAAESFYQGLLHRQIITFTQVQSRLKSYLSVQGSLDILEYLWLVNYASIVGQMDRADAPVFPQRIQRGWQGTQPPSLAYLLQISDALLACKQQVMANVAPQLAFEALVIDLLK